LFSGRDTAWQNVWLCFDPSWAPQLKLRFTLLSDSITSNRDGWMLDNFLINLTWAHTINEFFEEKYISASPNPSTGQITINTRKTNDYHIIEHIAVRDVKGNIVKTFGRSPVKVTIDLEDLDAGQYFLMVKTNKSKEVIPIVLVD
jgi:hypothetical protein